jgi:uncharacterized protein YrrD
MDLYFNATVEQRDGDTLGHLQAVVCDPETREVRDLVIEGARWGEGPVLVPIGAVDSADDDAVIVALTDEQYDNLDTFASISNVAPPPVADNSADLEEEPIDLPDVPPVGAATGVESIAFTPVIEEVPHIPADDEVLSRAATIYATDGELGHVRALTVDDQTRRVTHFLGEHGLIFPHDFDVPIDVVSAIRSETVMLSVSRAEIEVSSNA